MFECFDFLECALAFTVLFYTYLPSALAALRRSSARTGSSPATHLPHGHPLIHTTSALTSTTMDLSVPWHVRSRPSPPCAYRLFHLPPPPSCSSAFAAHHLPASIPAIIAPDRTFACSSPSGFEKRVGFAVSGCFLCSVLVCWLCFWSVWVGALCCRRWLSDRVYGTGSGARFEWDTTMVLILRW